MTQEPAETRQELERAPDPTPGGAGAWLFGAWIGAFVVVVIIAAWLLGKDEGKRQAEDTVATLVKAAPAKTTEAAAPVVAGPGKALFAAKCGSCHTLKAAGTSGAAGPSMDDLMPDAAQVEAAIHNGGAGSGAMPKGLAAGVEAKQIADYISKASGSGG